MNSILVDAFNWIERKVYDASSKIVEVNGLQYLKNERGLDLITEHYAHFLDSKTLESITAWLECPEVHESAGGEYFINVPRQNDVLLYSRVTETGQRNLIVRAQHEETRFSFGQYMCIEDFIINVQTCFVDTPEKQQVINFASKVKGEKVEICEDNGIAQVVSVVDKVGRLEDKSTNPIITLKPRRTFCEVEQPSSLCLFRVKRVSGELCCGLFEADSGAWKVEAIQNIVKYFREHPVVISKDIKVVG